MKAALSTDAVDVSSSRRWVVWVTLGLGLLHGLVYLVLVPPWQHNDEPGHFEFAWLIANQPGFPQHGNYDEAMRLELQESMRNNHFFDDLEVQPAARDTTGKPWIGVAQIDRFDLYYRLIAVPIFLFRDASLEMQLYAGRAFSLSLYLTTLGLCILIIQSVTAEGSALRWMVPFSLALTPGLTDLMTSVNSDVAATTAFTFFLWASIRVLNGGWHWRSVILLLVSIVLCAWAKPTSLPALVLVFLLPLFELLRVKPRLTLLVCSAVIFICLLTAFSWDDADDWLRATGQKWPTRTNEDQAPLGNASFALLPYATDARPQIFQLITPSQVELLRGRTLTLGAWVWSTQTVEALSPALVLGGDVQQVPLTATREPTFHALHIKIPHDVWRMYVTLDPLHGEGIGETPVFYDGVVLAVGSYDLRLVPVYHTVEGKSGEWGARNFVNLLQNGSAERTGIRLNPWMDARLSQIYPGRVAVITGSLFNLDQVGWYYNQTIHSLFSTFWGRFGWGLVALLGDPWSYRILAVISAAGILGCGVAAWRRRNILIWQVGAFLGLVTTFIWMSTIIRGVPTLNLNIFWPGARYAAVVVVPVFLVLNAGWRELYHLLVKAITVPRWLFMGIFLAFFFTLDLLSFCTLITYFN